MVEVRLAKTENAHLGRSLKAAFSAMTTLHVNILIIRETGIPSWSIITGELRKLGFRNTLKKRMKKPVQA